MKYFIRNQSSILLTDFFGLVSSGDMDARVPVTATKLSINELKLPIETPWYPWVNGFEVNNQFSFMDFSFMDSRGWCRSVDIL